MATLYLIATPIGNLEDITLRALRVLREVDVLACEDTRHTRILLDRHDIPKPKLVFSYHEHNEEHACGRIIDLLEQGLSVGVCTNAGYPGISDPGYLATCRAIAKEISVEVVPGASAVQTALVSSGLPSSSYTFKGFPPRKPGRRRAFIEQGKDLPHTLVFFESPYRVAKFLQNAYEVLGDRQAAVCVELTKKFENINRGYLSDLLERFEDLRIKGEVTIVIAGNHPKFVQPATGTATVSDDVAK